MRDSWRVPCAGAFAGFGVPLVGGGTLIEPGDVERLILLGALAAAVSGLSRWLRAPRRPARVARATDFERLKAQLPLQAAELERDARTSQASAKELQQRNQQQEVERLNTALRRRVAEMETLLEVIPVGIGMAHDPACQKITVNPAFAALLGIAPDANASKSGPNASELPFRVCRDGREVPPEELPLQYAAAHGVPLSGVELDVVRDDGQTITLWESAAPLFDEHGSVRGSVGAFVDITERKRREEESRRLAEVSRVLAASLDVHTTLQKLAAMLVPWRADYCLIYLVEADGGFRQTASAHTDPAKSQLLEELGRVFRPEQASAWSAVAGAFSAQQPIVIPEVSDEHVRSLFRHPEVLRVYHALGPASHIVAPLVARGQALGAIVLGATRESGRRYSAADLPIIEQLAARAALAVDNAKLYEAEHAARAGAEEANYAKTQFLTVMSHELRTPLNAIAGYAELLELGVRGPVTDAQREDLRRIQRSQRHLLSLITDVLNFARIEAGQVELDLADVPLQEAVAGIDTLVEPQLRSKGLQYEHYACDSRLAARADAEKLRQILLNLLSNAIKFTRSGGHVTVECGEEREHVLVRVRDTGRGIPADKLEAIFEPFVQVDRALTTAHEGTGLGLAISRDLARAMGGDLGVESVQGEGSTFTLRLPRAAAEAVRSLGEVVLSRPTMSELPADRHAASEPLTDRDRRASGSSPSRAGKAPQDASVE